jgi:hypothetical protein
MPTTPLTADATRLKVPDLLKGRVDEDRAMQRALWKVWTDAAASDPEQTAQLARQRDLEVADPGAAAAEKYGESHALDQASERTGRAKTSPAKLQQVARIVRDAEMAGVPYAEKVAEKFGVSESTARAWKRKAIARGHLKIPGKPTHEGDS